MVNPLIAQSLAYASGLAFLSMGLTLTYITTRVPNFAHASFAVAGMYAVLWLTKLNKVYEVTWKNWIKLAATVDKDQMSINEFRHLTSILSSNVYSFDYFTLGFPLAFLFGAAIAVAMYVLILKPLADRGNTVTGLMIATFAFDIIMLAVYTMYAYSTKPSYGAYELDPLARYALGFQPEIAGTPATAIVGPVIVLVVAVVFWAFLRYTKFGIAMRAAIENPSLAETVGVNVKLVYLVSWVIAGGLAGMAGVLLVYNIPANPNAAALIIVSVFAGSIAGGLSSIFGGLIGGYIVGLFELLGSRYSGDLISWMASGITGHTVQVNLLNYPKLFSLGTIIVVLLIFPQGIGGIDWGNVRKKFLARFSRPREKAEKAGESG